MDAIKAIGLTIELMTSPSGTSRQPSAMTVHLELIAF